MKASFLKHFFEVDHVCSISREAPLSKKKKKTVDRPCSLSIQALLLLLAFVGAILGAKGGRKGRGEEEEEPCACCCT